MTEPASPQWGRKLRRLSPLILKFSKLPQIEAEKHDECGLHPEFVQHRQVGVQIEEVVCIRRILITRPLFGCWRGLVEDALFKLRLIINTVQATNLKSTGNGKRPLRIKCHQKHQKNLGLKSFQFPLLARFTFYILVTVKSICFRVNFRQIS